VVRDLHVVSFENDLDSLRLACRNIKHFPYLRHGGPGGLLERGEWHSKKYPGLHWHLVEGDFWESMGKAPHAPDLIFFDMFSTRTDAPSWSVDAFRRLFSRCADRDVELFTYTASTGCRVAMLSAGFYVAKGRATDVKAESTIALTEASLRRGTAARHQLLGAAFLKRWNKSHVQVPADLPEGDREAFEKAILDHPQFAD
jgi:queuine tRNA-ribosyltransferase